MLSCTATARATVHDSSPVGCSCMGVYLGVYCTLEDYTSGQIREFTTEEERCILINRTTASWSDSWLDYSQPSIFLYFYSIVERASRIARELDDSTKPGDMTGSNSWQGTKPGANFLIL